MILYCVGIPGKYKLLFVNLTKMIVFIPEIAAISFASSKIFLFKKAYSLVSLTY